MQTLAKESFQKIQYLIQNQNYANIYARLLLELPQSESSLFSKILLRGEGAEWVMDDNRTYHRFAEANPEEKELIAICLEQKKESILKRLGDLPYAKELFLVPSSDEIFYCKDEMDNISVTLTEWGFRSPRVKDDIDVISALIAAPRKLVQSEVNVLVKYSDGLPASNESFNLAMFGSTVPFKTNDEGRFYVGRLINGKNFTISDAKGNEKTFIVDPTVEIYEVELPCYTNYDITVTNQEGAVCADFSLSVNGQSQVTNAEGKIVAEEFVLAPDKLTVEVYHEETNHKEVYNLSHNPEENHFKFVYNEKFTSSLDVTVHYPDGEGLPHFRVRVGVNEYETDEYGFLHVDDLEPDTTVKVCDVADCNHFVDVPLQRGDNKAELVMERPQEQMVRIRLLDRKGEPLQNLPIKLVRKEGELEATTDADGCVFFPAAQFTNGEKLKLTCTYKGRVKLKRIKAKKQ